MNPQAAANRFEAMELDGPSAEAVRAQLGRMTRSRTFASAPVLRRLLEHIVDSALQGRADELKEYALGVDVFGRGQSFEPRVDTIVRVQARRLRFRLEEYYRTEGCDDPVLIELPKGHYVPGFRLASGLRDRRPRASADPEVNRPPAIADELEVERAANAAGTPRTNPDPASAPSAAVPPRVTRRHILWVGLGTCLLLVVILVAVLGTRSLRPVDAGARAVTPTDAVPHSGPTERDRVLLTDFVNRTGDEVFDGTLTRALAFKLEESPFLSIVPEERVRETLRLMNRSADDPVTLSIGRDICTRQAVKALITGEIVRLDDGYAIDLTAVDCATGDVLARAHGEAPAKAAVLATLGGAGGRLRASLGERLSSVKALDRPLPEATTESLEALKAFSMGEDQRARGRTLEAIPFYTRAIELDSEFALAYARLALLHTTMYQMGRAAEYAARAFEHVDRVSERERLYILEAYHRLVSFDVDRHRDTIELWVKTYPRDHRAVQRLALRHLARGDCEDALAHSQKQMQLQPDAFAYGTLTLAYQCLGRFEEARAIAGRAIETDVDLPYVRVLLYQVAFALGDTATMQRQVEWAAGRPTEHMIRREQGHAAAALGQLGRARTLLQEAVAIAQANEVPENAGSIAAGAAVIEAITGDLERARTRAGEALAISRDESTVLWAALALGLAQYSGAQPLLEVLPSGQYPMLPVAWAVAARKLGQGRPLRTLEVLRATARHEPNEGTPFSQYLRGEAHLRMAAPADAAREFSKLAGPSGGPSGHPHFRDNWKTLLRVVAHARLGRAHALAGEIEQARAAYSRFFELWQLADPDVPLLKIARTEHAALPAPEAVR